MTIVPKYPREADRDFYLIDKIQKITIESEYLLTGPVSTFHDINSIIDGLPEQVLMNEEPENIYNALKTSLFNLINLNGSKMLPVNIREYIRKVYNFFSSRKTRAKFVKAFGNEVEANQPRINARKVAQERSNTHLQAQLLGVTFTRQGLDEFEQEYSSNTNHHSTSQASTTPHSHYSSTSRHPPQENLSPILVKKVM